MKFNDIIALAKQGYTPQDIKDLLALAEDQAYGKEAEQKDQDIDTKDSDQDNAEPEGEPDKKEDAEDLDYKAMYEAEVEKTSKLQKMVLSADLSDKQTENDIDVFADAMKLFM